MRRLSAVGVVTAIALPLFFFKLGGAGLVDPDEPYYAVPALEMLKAGRWAVPLFRGQPWFDKPVLFYWVVLAAFKTFGVSEWAARIGSALAGLGGTVVLATMAPRRWRAGTTGLLAAIILATSLEYALLARSAVTDMTLTFFLTVGFLAVARHLEDRGLTSAACAGAAFGLAALTKGPVGLLLPVVAIAGYGAATRRRELLAPKALVATAGGFLAVAAPWYLYMLSVHRELLLGTFLGTENLGRFTHPEHRQIPLFYVWVLAAGLLPWSYALPAALVRALRAWRHGDERTGDPPGPVFALCWFASVLFVFSLSASKLATYILPAFPAAAYLIADDLTARRRKLVPFAAVHAAITIVVVVAVVGFAWPAFETSKSTRTLVRQLAAEGLSGELAGTYRVSDVSLDFYLARSLPRETELSTLARRVAAEPGRLWVVRSGDTPALAAGASLIVTPVLTVSRRAVVRLSPAPEVAR